MTTVCKESATVCQGIRIVCYDEFIFDSNLEYVTLFL